MLFFKESDAGYGSLDAGCGAPFIQHPVASIQHRPTSENLPKLSNPVIPSEV
jgi:hypothetical protein